MQFPARAPSNTAAPAPIVKKRIVTASRRVTNRHFPSLCKTRLAFERRLSRLLDPSSCCAQQILSLDHLREHRILLGIGGLVPLLMGISCVFARIEFNYMPI